MINAIRRFWWVPLVGMVLGGLAASTLTTDALPRFKSRALLSISPPSDASAAISLNNNSDRYIAGQISLITSESMAARVATDPSWLRDAHGDAAGICGVAAVSGAAYDLGDIETYRLGFDPTYFAERFGGSRLDGTWWRDASVWPWLDASDPPFLVMFATGEDRPLRRQSTLFDQKLRAAGVASTVVTVKGSSHSRMILELSRGDKTAGPAVLKFLRDTPCPRPSARNAL